MIISEKEKLHRILSKLQKAPEMRQIAISEGQNLLVEGKIKLLIENYIAIGPWGNYWQINNYRNDECPTCEYQAARPLVTMTETKFLFNVNQSDAFLYFSPKNSPEKGDFILLLLLTPRFAEMLYLDENSLMPFHAVLAPQNSDSLLGLCITLIKAHQEPQLAEDILLGYLKGGTAL